MAIHGQHSFLETVKESEALARGANLSDKINHAVLKAIKGASTRQTVKANQHFTLDTFVPDIVNLTKADLRRVISRLIAERVVVQIFRLEYSPGHEQMLLVPCYLANANEEENQIVSLFNDTVFQSITAVESFLDARPPADRNAFVAELEVDLTSERVPPMEKLPRTVVDPFASVHAKNFDIVPPAELLSVTVTDIRKELIRRNRVRVIPDYGLMPVRETDILDRLEICDDFLVKRLVPKYRNRGSCKRELEQISMEEAAYSVEAHATPTGQFMARRAQTIKKAVLASMPPGKGVRFPGTLAVEIILQLEPLARERYEERARSENARSVRDFKEQLTALDGPWQDLIRFVRFDEVDKYHADVWQRLLEDSELIHAYWQTAEGLHHVFARREPAVFRRLVHGMASLPPERKWQILAMRALLEQHESKPEFKALFDDPAFVESFGKLLRLCYMDRIGWLHRLLLQLGILWFQDRSFQIAKQSIRNEQERLRVRNDARIKEHREKRDKERAEKVARVQDLTRANRIIEVLDQLYLTDRHIPSVADVRARVTEFSPEEFHLTLRRERFQIIAPPKGVDPDQGILLYPLNHEWRSRAARLRKMLDRLLEDAESSPEEAAEAKELVGRINRFIARTESRGKGGEQDADPYEAFEKEIEKHKEKERQAEDSEF